jgi:hypothetical protein
MSPASEGWRCLLVTFKKSAVVMATRENKLGVSERGGLLMEMLRYVIAQWRLV